MRAAMIYGVSLVVVGNRANRKPIGHSTDTYKGHRHIPTIVTDDVMDMVPYDCVPIAVDLLEDATPLPEFEHPERAFYVFGAEGATLGKRVVSSCAHSVFIPSPTGRCSNLAVAVNIVLYDRFIKRTSLGITHLD